MKKPLVTILAGPLDDQNAGIHVYTREMIRSFQESKTCEYILVRQKHNNKFSEKIDEITIPSHPFIGFKTIRLFLTVPFILSKVNPDIVIEPAHFGPFNLPKRIKRVTIIHDLTPIIFPQWHRFLGQLLQRIFLKSILKHASLILTNSENTLKDLTKYFSFTAAKSIMIYPGIDPFYNLPEKDIIYKKEPFLLYTGTIEPRKNLITLLVAYQKFRERSGYKHKLIITGGKGWKSESFYKTLEEHPFRQDIELKGYVSKEELRLLYRTTSAFIYPSFYEGFGFPVAEAMSSGACCIVSKSSSLIEVGGNSVVYFDPTNPEELADKIALVLTDEKLVNTLIRKGKEHVSKFNWENFAAKFERELVKLATSKNNSKQP